MTDERGQGVARSPAHTVHPRLAVPLGTVGTVSAGGHDFGQAGCIRAAYFRVSAVICWPQEHAARQVQQRRKVLILRGEMRCHLRYMCAQYWRRFIADNEVDEVYIVTQHNVTIKGLRKYHGEVFGEPRDPVYDTLVRTSPPAAPPAVHLVAAPTAPRCFPRQSPRCCVQPW